LTQIQNNDIIKESSAFKAVTSEQRKSLKNSVTPTLTFHVGIVRESNTKAHLYWNANGTQLTNVSRTILLLKMVRFVWEVLVHP
jgi:hypothetical protein